MWWTNNFKLKSYHPIFFICLLSLGKSQAPDKFEKEEDDLNSTHDGKPSEESHGASNQTKLGLKLDLLVPLDLVEGGRVKVDLD